MSAQTHCACISGQNSDEIKVYSNQDVLPSARVLEPRGKMCIFPRLLLTCFELTPNPKKYLIIKHSALLSFHL